MSNGVATDVELIARKQKEITRARLIQAALLIIIVLLVGVIATLAILSRVSLPAPEPRVDVISHNTKLQVPDTITVGEPFVYTTKGTKNYENSADVRLQTLCIIDGNEVINSFSTFYSVIPKGDYELKRTTSLTQTARTLNSDNCKLQSIATYTFYLIDNGIERSFTVTEFNESNTFRLIVPPEEVSQSTQPTAAPQAAAPTPQSQQSETIPQPEPQVQPVPQPDVVNPTPPPVSCVLGLPVNGVPLLGGLLCR